MCSTVYVGDEYSSLVDYLEFIDFACIVGVSGRIDILKWWSNYNFIFRNNGLHPIRRRLFCIWSYSQLTPVLNKQWSLESKSIVHSEGDGYTQTSLLHQEFVLKLKFQLMLYKVHYTITGRNWTNNVCGERRLFPN